MKTLLFMLLIWVHCADAATEVSHFATGGNGTEVSPWVGWDTTVNWEANKEYHFLGGVYSYVNSPNFLKHGIALVGEAGTVLKHTGNGIAVNFDNPNSWTDPGPRFENFTIQSNPGTTTALFLRGVRNGVFRNLTVNGGVNGIVSEACVTNTMQDVRVYFSQNGIILKSRETNSNDASTTWVLTNVVVEFTTGIATWIQPGSYGNVYIGGTSESNTGKGDLLAGHLNTVIGRSNEANGGGNVDFELRHNRNHLLNVYSGGNTLIMAGQGNKLSGGHFKHITIPSNVDFTYLENIYYNGVLSDGSLQTMKLGTQGELDGGLHFNSFINHVVERMKFLDFAPTMNTDASRFFLFFFVAFGNFTLNNPTNGLDGQHVVWRIQQDNTGSRVISFGSKFRSKGAFPTLTPTPLSFTYITARYNSVADTWDLQ